MNLQYLLYNISFLIIYFSFSASIRNKELIAIKSGLAEISPCSIGLQFYAEFNNIADEDYFVELISDECCIISEGDTDCDSIEIIGESSKVIEKGNTNIFTMVAPVLNPFERHGYCIIHVDSRPIDKRSDIMRDTITIDFDTAIKDGDNIYSGTISKCKNIDEDPLNDCKPVNCDINYNGKKPIYDENTKKCTEIPKWRSKKSEASNVYDPNTDKCMVVDPIVEDDIDFIKTFNKDRQPKDVIIVESPEDDEKNCIIDSKTILEDATKQKYKADVKRKFICSSLLQYLLANKYTLSVLGIVIFVQFCLICTMIYCLTNRSIRCNKTKIERKYFNYRQDVSVTTPLIDTSNMDTETALDYISESSNIEKKIKCYKSCQKDRKNDAKISMSDDILTKCINRRNWDTKPKSDTVKDANDSYVNNLSAEWKTLQTKVKETKTDFPVTEKEEKGTNMETRCQKNQTRVVRHSREEFTDSDGSEKFIKCHNYNFVQSIKVGTDNNNKRPPSISTEKGAQASFSNDSIDDYLSERGMIFLAGDGLSKYSFTSNSTANRTDSSSKTSKNRNMVKNVMSYLSRKSKKYTSSDPGMKQDSGKDLELIHMSRASMYSSSVSDYRNIHGAKFAKDSRSTF